MTKVLSVTDFRSNLAAVLEYVCKSNRNQIIVKRQKGKGNIVVLSQEAFKSIVETFYLLSSKKNKEVILESIQQSKAGKTTKIKLKDLWK